MSVTARESRRGSATATALDLSKTHPQATDPTAVGATTSTRLPAHDVAVVSRLHRYAVAVVATRSDGRAVTSLFSSLPAATRKVERTRERGLGATAVLVELRPVDDVVELAEGWSHE